MSSESLSDRIVNGLFLLIVFIFSFPVFAPEYGSGLDASYIWGLNWLFANDYDTLCHVIYPLGPLAFLKYPAVIGSNFVWALTVYSIIKVVFILLLLKTMRTYCAMANKVATWLLILLMCCFANIDLMIIGSCILLSLLFIKEEQKLLSILFAALIASLGLFIKSSIGTISFSIIAVALIIDFCKNKTLKESLLFLLIVLIMFAVSGMVVFGGFITFAKFIYGTFRMILGYGVMSIPVHNNWILLSLFIFVMLIFPLTVRERNIKTLFLLAIIPFFAFWKHAMVRGDMSHYMLLIYFVIIFWGIVILIVDNAKLLSTFVALFTVMLLFGNLPNVPDYEEPRKQICGVNNFSETIFNRKNIEEKYSALSKQNVAVNMLSQEEREIIGNATVDVFPWDFSYIAANDLNWMPRTTLSHPLFKSKMTSGYNHWIEKDGYSCPSFILFHFVKDNDSCFFGSIDGKYMLNEEPDMTFQLLDEYSVVLKNSNYMLLKKDTTAYFAEKEREKEQTVGYDEWIETPHYSNAAVRAYVKTRRNFLGAIKSFFYKDDIYYVDYMLADNSILTYRFSPSAAEEGLWCNPFIKFPYSNKAEETVEKIRFRNSSNMNVSPKIKLSFEKINITGNFAGREVQLFGTQEEVVDDCTITLNNDSIGVLKSGDYSYCVKYDLATLWNEHENFSTLIVEADVNLLNASSTAHVIISTEATDNSFWESEPVKPSSQWQTVCGAKTISKHNNPAGLLKCYVWNSGNSDVNINEMRVVIKGL